MQNPSARCSAADPRQGYHHPELTSTERAAQQSWGTQSCLERDPEELGEAKITELSETTGDQGVAEVGTPHQGCHQSAGPCCQLRQGVDAISMSGTQKGGVSYRYRDRDMLPPAPRLPGSLHRRRELKENLLWEQHLSAP